MKYIDKKNKRGSDWIVVKSDQSGNLGWLRYALSTPRLYDFLWYVHPPNISSSDISLINTHANKFWLQNGISELIYYRTIHNFTL